MMAHPIPPAALTFPCRPTHAQMVFQQKDSILRFSSECRRVGMRLRCRTQRFRWDAGSGLRCQCAAARSLVFLRVRWWATRRAQQPV